MDYKGDLKYNEYSWNNASNMIYIDQPSQVGLSYSTPIPGYVDPDSGYIVTLENETCPDYAQDFGTCGTYSYANFSLTAEGTPQAAPNVWRTLQGFMGAFPQYSRNSINLATQSYGGHYGPVFAEYFEKQNLVARPGTHNIDLQHLSIGNGWYEPILQYQAYYNYTVFPGNTFNYKPFTPAQEARMYNAMYGAGNCVDQLIDCNTRKLNDICAQADNFCYGVELLYDTVTKRDEYDIRYLVPNPFPYTFFVEYLNRPEIQQAIGAYQNFSYSSGNFGSGTVANAFLVTGDDARAYNIISDFRKLLDQGVSIALYAGDADYNCNWLGGEAVASLIGADGFAAAGYTSLTTSDGEVRGATKQAGNFSFTRVYDAGHYVPYYKPLAALEMFERLLGGKDIATGQENVTDDLITTGPSRSTYQNDTSDIQQKKVGKRCRFDSETNLPVCPGDGGYDGQ